MIDVVFPNKNEQTFLDMAKQLGIEKLCMVYPSVEAVPETVKNKDNIIIGVLNQRSPGTLMFCQSSEKDRELLEGKAPHVMFGLEGMPRKDFLHQRASGLNHILARLAAKNNVRIAFSFSSILAAEGEARAVLMGRISQNIMLCRKAKAPMLVGSFARTPLEMRNPADLQSFFQLVGMHASEAQAAMTELATSRQSEV
ncbi:hypothetical protein HY642_00835 [Candidatus Woesearchaeota archaeon]|nr:hypothetical protein [Candidatus Woesearchaeota archaeon]